MKTTFEFTPDQLKEFEIFLRSATPLMLINWPRSENRLTFPGMPKYKLLGILEDYDSEDEEATTTIHAIFEANVKIPGFRPGNAIWLKQYYGIEQTFITSYDPQKIIEYLIAVKQAEYLEKSKR